MDLSKKNVRFDKFSLDLLNHIHSIKNKDLLTSCLDNELKDIKIKEFSYKNGIPEMNQLLLRFDKWIAISIEDDHISLSKVDELINFNSGDISFKFVDSKPDLNIFLNLKLKNYNTITNDSRFAIGLCLDFGENGRFIFANLGYDRNGKDYKQIMIEK